MTNEANIQDLADQICRLDLPFDPETIVAIVRSHVAVVPAGPRIPMVVRLLDPGIMRIDTLRLFAAEFHIPEDGIANVIRAAKDEVPRPDMLPCWMSYMQNRGRADEPRYVIAVPDDAVCEML